MDVTKLEAFDVQTGARAGHLILVTGDPRYKTILRDTFPECGFTHSFPDSRGEYDWGTYIHELPDRTVLERFLSLLTRRPCIFDDLDQCFVLGRHGKWDSSAGAYVRTKLGELLNRAKPYGPGDGDRKAAAVLAERLASFIEDHPAYARAEAIVPVPPSNPDKPYDLPTYLAEQLCGRLGKTDGRAWVRKVRATYQQKEIHTSQEKVENVEGAFKATRDVVGRSIIVLDDLYQSGATINEVGRTLRAAGAGMVLGLATTKTQKDV